MHATFFLCLWFQTSYKDEEVACRFLKDENTCSTRLVWYTHPHYIQKDKNKTKNEACCHECIVYCVNKFSRLNGKFLHQDCSWSDDGRFCSEQHPAHVCLKQSSEEACKSNPFCHWLPGYFHYIQAQVKVVTMFFYHKYIHELVLHRFF